MFTETKKREKEKEAVRGIRWEGEVIPREGEEGAWCEPCSIRRAFRNQEAAISRDRQAKALVWRHFGDTSSYISMPVAITAVAT